MKNGHMNTRNFDYQADPKAIEHESFRQIRELTDLTRFSMQEQQVVMRIVHSVGLPEVAEQVVFSQGACQSGCHALANQRAILCDVEMVKQGLTKRMLDAEPLCFLNDKRVPELAKSCGETRSMAALDFWQPHLKDSIVIIGNAPTALFRLLEMIQAGCLNQRSLLVCQLVLSGMLNLNKHFGSAIKV